MADKINEIDYQIIETKSNGPRTICKYCDAVSEPGVKPPLCALHLDLVVLIAFMQKRDEAITAEGLKARLRQARARGGRWAITEDDVDVLLSDLIGRETDNSEETDDSEAADNSEETDDSEAGE